MQRRGFVGNEDEDGSGGIEEVGDAWVVRWQNEWRIQVNGLRRAPWKVYQLQLR